LQRRAPTYVAVTTVLVTAVWAADTIDGWALFAPIVVLGPFLSHLHRLADAETPQDSPRSWLYHAGTVVWAVAWTGALVALLTGGGEGGPLTWLFVAASILYGVTLVLAHRRKARGEPGLRRDLPSAFGRALIAHPIVAGTVMLALAVTVVLLAPETPGTGVGTWWVIGFVAFMVYGAAMAWFLPRLIHRPAAQALELSIALAQVPLWVGFISVSLSDVSGGVLYAGAGASAALSVALLVRATAAPPPA
jgi:hypothetical protein